MFAPTILLQSIVSTRDLGQIRHHFVDSNFVLEFDNARNFKSAVILHVSFLGISRLIMCTSSYFIVIDCNSIKKYVNYSYSWVKEKNFA